MAGQEAEQKVVKSEENSLLRDLRKVSEPKFSGKDADFVVWKDMLLLSAEGYGVQGFLLNNSLSAYHVTVATVDRFKEKLQSYMATMIVMRMYLLRLLPVHLQTQLTGLPGLKKSAVLTKVTIDEDVVLELENELSTKASACEMFQALCKRFEQPWLRSKCCMIGWIISR